MAKLIVRVAAAASMLLAASGLAHAQKWPEKPVTLMVAYGAGGGFDQQARDIAKTLSEQLGQPFIVQNKPGGGGTVAAMLVNASPADGSTLLITTSSTFTFEPLLTKIAATDLRHVAIIGQTQEALITSPKAPYPTFGDMLKDAKANNKSLKFASSYQLDRVIMAVVAKSAGVKIIPVPMQGGTSVITATIGDQVDFGISGATWGPYAELGQIKVIAAATRDRFPSDPNMPTLKDLGFNVGTEVYTLVSVPKATPDAVVRQIEAALKTAVNAPSYIDIVVKRNKMRHLIVVGEAEATAMVNKQADYYRDLVASVGQVE